MFQFTKDIDFDRPSYQLGGISAFMEMIDVGLKKLALGPPVTADDFKKIETGSKELAEKFNAKTYLEKSLLVTRLFPATVAENKWVLMAFKDDSVLNEYLELKKKKETLIALKKLSEEQELEIARSFGKLLSYPEDKIEKMLATNNFDDC